METEDVRIYRAMRKCKECKFYDPTPFPEYKGALAICRSEHPGDGRYKIGRFTVAIRDCFEEKEGANNGN